MSEYRKISGPRDSVRYVYRPGPETTWRRIPYATMPSNVRAKLADALKGSIYDDTREDPVIAPTPQGPAPKVCIFCDEPGTSSKYINAQMVYLCATHYENKTTGEVVHQLRVGNSNESN